jgi:hypothetical protein
MKLTASDRPDEISHWFRIGRRLFGKKNMPEIKSIQVFEDKWLKWWARCQPKWRKTERWPFPQDDADVGDWERLPLGGKDGLFIVVMSLGWWAHARDPAVDSKLDDAIDDVSWVTKHLNTSIAAEVLAHDSSPPSTPAPPTPPAPLQAGSRKIGPPRKRWRKL